MHKNKGLSGTDWALALVVIVVWGVNFVVMKWGLQEVSPLLLCALVCLLVRVQHERVRAIADRVDGDLRDVNGGEATERRAALPAAGGGLA